MEKNMLDYIRETPGVLKNNIDRREELTKTFTALYLEQGGPITVVAAGSSYNAAMCAKPFMEKILAVQVNVFQPFSYLYYDQLPQNDGFTVVVSQSGSSTNAIDAMAEARRRTGKGIGITGCRESEMGRQADVLIEYGVEEESVGWVTKGELTLDLFLKLCALDIAEKTGRLTAREVESWLEEMRRAADCFPKLEKMTYELIRRHAKLFTSMEHAYIIGAGPGYGVALEGALKNGETIRIPAFAYEMEEFLHGPNYQLSPTHTVMMIDCDPRTHRRVMEIAEACDCVTDRIFVVSSLPSDEFTAPLADRVLSLDAGIDPYVSSFALLPFFQLTAYHMAEQLHRWERHPMFPPFRIKCGSKTKEYLENNS